MYVFFAIFKISYQEKKEVEKNEEIAFWLL